MSGTTSDVVAAAHEVVAAIERAQRDESVDDFVALFTDDAVWTTATGTRLVGREQIRAFSARVLPGAMRGLRGTTYEPVEVRSPAPGVAVVLVRQRYRHDDGTPVDDGGEGAPMYVLVEAEGRWRLAAGQNTLVRAPAQDG